MPWQLDATPWMTADADWLIVGLPEACELSGPLASLDQALDGQLTRLREAGMALEAIQAQAGHRSIESTCRSRSVLF